MHQKPGLMAGLTLTRFGPQEIEITNNLAAVWFVAYAGEQVHGKSSLPYVFLKPCDSFKERFNFFNDILCIFHPFPEIDSRVFEAMDRILSAHQHRLDRLCVVLITNAETISDALRKNDLDSDPRVVVPFKYQELRGGVGGKERLMLDQFERNLFTKDLFAMSSALKTDRFFFGRKDEIQKLVGHYQNGENSTVFGLRRIGKTSILWAVVRTVKDTNAPVVFVDCNDTRFHKTTWNKALFRIKEALYLSNGLAKTGFGESAYSEADASTCFTEDLLLVKKKFGKPSLLIFDEIQNICFDLSSSEKWASGDDFLPFWQAIRSAYQQTPNLFSFILCGTNAHIIEAGRLPSGLDNPLFGYVKPYYLGFFDTDDVKNMLSQIGSYMGASFDPQIFTYLTDDFGGHPFLIRQACSYLWNLQVTKNVPRNVLVRKTFYQTHKDNLISSTRNYINLILQVLTERYPREFELLRLLAAGDHEKFQAYAQDRSQDIEHLIGYGLIEKMDGKYHFRISAVESAVKENARDLRCPDSVDERWALISKERNQFEFRLREFVRASLRASLGKTEAKSVIIGVMTKPSQVANAEKLDYDEIFHKEFYFLNLKDVVVKNWQNFRFIFNNDKQKFMEAMDAGNKLRADAHAKSITPDQFKQVMPKLVWLSKSFDDAA